MSCIFCLIETKIVNLMTLDKKVPRKRMLMVISLPFFKSFLFSHTFETKLNQLLRQGSSLPTCNFSKWLLRLCVCGFVGFFFLFKYPHGQFLSAPGDQGWEFVLDKSCLLATLYKFIYENICT